MVYRLCGQVSDFRQARVNAAMARTTLVIIHWKQGTITPMLIGVVHVPSDLVVRPIQQQEHCMKRHILAIAG
jgi:hypothetical protein